MELLKELHAEGSTILMVTHDPRYSAYAERTIHLFDGRVVGEEDRVNPPAASSVSVSEAAV
jgi:putative ABC transport system ATP-binding protein